MSLAIVNGGNIFGRQVFKRLASMYNSIRLCDYKVHRPAVCSLLRETKGEKARVEKMMLTNTYSLERAIEGCEKVLCFTHDYFTLAPDKFQMLRATADATRKLGVKQLVCVCPIELDLYAEQKLNPFEMRQDAEHKAMKCNPEMTLLRTNLVFGEESYLIKYLTQCVLAGTMIYPQMESCGKQKYYPVHFSDLASCIVHALDNTQIKGLEYSVRGTNSITYDGILEVLQQHCGVASVQKKRRSLIAGVVEKFFIGTTHDKNMMRMAEWHERERQNFMNDWNYLEKFGIKETHDFRAYHHERKPDEGKYIEPHLHKYKCIAID